MSVMKREGRERKRLWPDENLVNLLYFMNLSVKKQIQDLQNPKQDVNHSNAIFNIYSIWTCYVYAAPTP
jgi:hypothetical protein